MNEQEAYVYANYIQNLKGAKIHIAPAMKLPIKKVSDNNNHNTIASSFMESALNTESDFGFEKFFTQKKELSEDKISLILEEINNRDLIKQSNLKMLYEDLLRINNWRLERPFPDCYKQDRLWSDLNKSELQIREQIRKEMKDAAKDAAFPQKDLREALLGFKTQTQKNNLIGGLEMELESSYLAQTGDQYS